MNELNRQRQREDKRKEKHLKKIREQEQQEFNQKIRSEEKKLLVAQRKLEGIRVLEALFDRLKVGQMLCSSPTLLSKFLIFNFSIRTAQHSQKNSN